MNSSKASTSESVETNQSSKDGQAPSTIDKSTPPVAEFDPLLERDKLHALTGILAIQHRLSEVRCFELAGAVKRSWQNYFKDKGSDAVKLIEEQQTKIDKALQVRLAHPLIAQRALHFIARYVFARMKVASRAHKLFWWIFHPQKHKPFRRLSNKLRDQCTSRRTFSEAACRTSRLIIQL